MNPNFLFKVLRALITNKFDMYFLIVSISIIHFSHTAVATETPSKPLTPTIGFSRSSSTTNASQIQLPMSAAALQTSSDTDRACILGDSECSWTGITTTLAGPTIPLHFDSECLLWDHSCSGNRTLALEEFFGGPDLPDDGTTAPTVLLVLENLCFVNISDDCTGLEPADILSEFEVVKTWMRSPQCQSSSSEAAVLRGDVPATIDEYTTCCWICYISAENVDVYYWPEPGSDTSCLGTIGNVTIPPLGGAITNSDGVYWGCTATNGSLVKTAISTQIGPITFKESLFNPWSSDPCDSYPSTSATLGTHALTARGLSAHFQARGNSLILPPNVTDSNGQRVSTVVTEGFTLSVVNTLLQVT